MLLRTTFLFILSLLLTGCLGGGGPETSTTVPVSSTSSAPGSSSSNVIDLAGQLPMAGEVGTGSLYLQLSGLSPTTQYMLVLSNPSDDIALKTYLDSTYFVNSCSSNYPGTNSEACTTISDSQGDLYFLVDGSGTANGAGFTIELYKPNDEGSASTPLEITGQLPYKGVHRSNSHYVVSGLTPGDVYTVTLSDMLFDSDLYTGMSKNFTSSCSSTNGSLTAEQCDVTANFEGKIYIKTDLAAFSATASNFTLDISATGTTAPIFEGYSDAPIDLTGQLPYSGEVAQPYDSYYKITGLTAGVRYEVRMDSPSAYMTGHVYTGSDYVSGYACEMRLTDDTALTRKSCVATAPASGELYLVYNSSGSDTTYTVDTVLAPVAEGTQAAPKVIDSSAALPYSGQVDGSDSYYVVTGLVAGRNYSIIVSQTSATTRMVASGDPASLTSGYCSTSFDTSCTQVARADGSGQIYIHTNGADSAGQGAWYELTTGDANNPEGSTATPLDISTAVSRSSAHSGQVDDTYSYYYLGGLNPGQRYMIHLADESDSYTSIYAFSDSAYSNVLCYNGVRCLAPANGTGELYIRIGGVNNIRGSTYHLWAAPSLIEPEGSVSTPLDITSTIATSGQYAGQVSSYPNSTSTSWGYSYYQISGLPGSTTYTISLSNLTDNADLDIYTSSGFTTPVCTAKHDALQDESCSVLTGAAGGNQTTSLYIRVGTENLGGLNSTAWDGARFTLSVSQSGSVITSEGTLGAPVDLTGLLPYQGEVSRDLESYYKITGLDPALSYAITVVNDTEDLNHYVYSDSGFSTTACAASTRSVYSKHCSATPSTLGELYLKVDPSFAQSPARYTITLAQGPVSEGSAAAAVDLTPTSLPYAGEVAANEFSYYRVSGLTPSSEYLFEVTDTTRSVRITAYSSNLFDGSGYECSISLAEPAESCLATSNSAGELYLMAEGDFYGSGYFTLNLVSPPQQEGSQSAPLSLTAGTIHRGQKAYGDTTQTRSYYKVSGLTPHSSHRASLSNMRNDQWVKIYADANYQYELCYSGYDNDEVGCSASANEFGDLYIEVGYIETGYYDLFVP